MASWTKKETYQFIQLYKSEPILWNSQQNKDSRMVHKAWDRISAVMKRSIPVLHLKGEELKQEFSNHFKRIQRLLRTGANYKTFAFFDTKEGFLEMHKFLKEVYDFNNTITTNMWDNDCSSEEEDSSKTLDKNLITTEPPKKKIKIQSDDQNNDSSEKVTGDADSDDDEINVDFHENLLSAFKLLQNLLELKLKKMETNEDECELYGKLVATKLRKFSESERQVIKHEIDDMIFQKFCESIKSKSNGESSVVVEIANNYVANSAEFDNEIKTEPCEDMFEVVENHIG